MEVYLEVGKSRVFAGAVDWPGWCRSGRDEASALEALLAYGPRYAKALSAAGLGFRPPTETAALQVVERLAGNSTTDFGAPAIAPSSDSLPVDAPDLARLEVLLQACWRAFDAAVNAAAGKELRTGPRGGGRDLSAIVQHTLGAEEAYVGQLGWKHGVANDADVDKALAQVRQAAIEGLRASVAGEIPPRGPRGGLRWEPRYFVRRAAWHVLDHAWEIEDRVQ